MGGDFTDVIGSYVARCQFNIQPSVYPFNYCSIPFSECLSHSTALFHHSCPHCNNDSLFLSPFCQPHIFFILFCSFLSSAVPSAAPGCAECLTFGGQQASVCVSEMSQLKSQTWQITTAIQKWTITSERRKNYEWEVMRSSRERTFRGAF